ncbi:DUF2165 domain-containing protein [Nocardia nova]|uniref:DUF2165 domain-containing protein n=1 Tax=Nocardia nova TaxID=37330 RepID=UPI0033CEB1D7
MRSGGVRILEVLGGRRAAVAVLTTITGFYYLFVAFTNCTDTATNRRGVAEVLSMRATIHDPATDWRALTSPALALIVYVLVVIWEATIALVLLAAAVAWARELTGRPRRVRVRPGTAARLSSLGFLLAVLLFAGAFLTVGGEWFRMWANKEVNASSAALQNFLMAGIGLILVHLPDRTPE